MPRVYLLHHYEVVKSLYKSRFNRYGPCFIHIIPPLFMIFLATVFKIVLKPAP